MKKFKHDKHDNSYYYIVKDKKSDVLVGLAFFNIQHTLYYNGKSVYTINNGTIDWVKHSIRL